jgi:hypothetical protein
MPERHVVVADVPGALDGVLRQLDVLRAEAR